MGIFQSFNISATGMTAQRFRTDIIAENTGADVVQVIGYKFVLYKANPDEPKIKLPKANKKV